MSDLVLLSQRDPVRLVEGTNDDVIRLIEEQGEAPTMIVADPNWKYANTGSIRSGKFRGTAKKHYVEGNNAAIGAQLRRAYDIAAPQSVMVLWTTCPQLLSGVLEALPHFCDGDTIRTLLRNLAVVPFLAPVLEPVLKDMMDRTRGQKGWTFKTSYTWRKVSEVILNCEHPENTARRIKGVRTVKKHQPGRFLRYGAPGTGFWLRGNVEIGLIFCKGGMPRWMREPGRRALQNGWETSVRNLEHSEKPLEVEMDLLKHLSRPGDLVLSLYSGMFVTGRAALLTGRRCVGAEVAPERHAEAMTCLERVRITMGEPLELPGSTTLALADPIDDRPGDTAPGCLEGRQPLPVRLPGKRRNAGAPQRARGLVAEPGHTD